MSTMLSDKVEQVSGAIGDAVPEEIMSDRQTETLRDDGTWSGGGTGPALGGSLHTGEALSSVKNAVRADAEEMVHRVEDYVIDHPLQALGIAVGVGFLLGVLWSH